MTRYELVSLVINLVSVAIAGFAASIAWKEYQRRREATLSKTQATLREATLVTSPGTEDYVTLVVTTIRRQDRESMKAYLLFILLIMVTGLGLTFSVSYFFLPFGNAEAMRSQPWWSIGFVLGPIVAVVVVGTVFYARATGKREAGYLRELSSILGDPRLTPRTAGEIVRAFTYNAAAYQNAVMISTLMFDTLAARSK